MFQIKLGGVPTFELTFRNSQYVRFAKVNRSKGITLPAQPFGPDTTDGKRKLRPGRRGVDAYGQPVHVVDGGPEEQGKAEQFEDGEHVGEMGGAETHAARCQRPLGCA